jgi:hypothetical protein
MCTRENETITKEVEKVMWVNLGTQKDEKKVWLKWLDENRCNVDVFPKGKPGYQGHNKELTEFFLKHLINKAKLDLRKSDNPEEAAKSWQPKFGRKKKSKLDKIQEVYNKLSTEDKAKIKELLND